MRSEKERQADQLAEERLELMSRSVRDKLDRVGLKIHLAEWQAMPLTDREHLRDWPCTTPDEVTRYAAEVEQLILRITGKAPDRLERKPRHQKN